MDDRANMRAMLENARRSIRDRASNASGAPAKSKVATIASASASRHPKPQPKPAEATEGPHFQKEPASGTEETDEATAVTMKENQRQFVQHYYRLLCAFIEDKSKYELELPNLSSLDRLVVHTLSEKCNLSHESAGSRNDRVMRLKKDILFFQQPDAARQVDVDEMIEKVSWKESKYQIRYVRSADPAQIAVGDIGSYADEDALQKIERFKRATDEYRHATDMGYSQQELLLAEAGAKTADHEEGEGFIAPGRLEDILSRPDPAAPAITAGPSNEVVNSPTSSSPTASSTAALAMKAAAATVKLSATTSASLTVYDEVCRACGTRVRLDGPPQGWKCSHYCAHCSRQTIWSLEEVKVQEVRAATSNSGNEANLHKRGRETAANDASVTQQRTRTEPPVEEIVRDVGEDGADATSAHSNSDSREEADGEEEGEGGLTIEDVMEVAATNDFGAKEMNWLREFAAHDTAHLGSRLAFCIDFSDLIDMRIFRRHDTAKAGTWYVVLREIRELSVAVADLLRELMRESLGPVTKGTEASAPPVATARAVEEIHSEEAETRAMEHLGVAFPNLSVYGTECVVVCQLRPTVRSATVPKMSIHVDALQRLRQRYGERHFFLTASLQDAVAHASETTSA